jgi:ABC-type polysaccharide/polyol phosphate export permease
MTTRTTAPPPHAEYFPAAGVQILPLRWLASLEREFAELARFWPVVQNMVLQEIRVRYQRSILGFFWTLLNPILMLMVLSFVFSHIMTQRGNYTVYLFAGMTPWSFLSSTIGEGAFCFIQNEGLIKKIYLPKILFPLVRTLINLTTLGFSMLALFILLVPIGARVSWSILSLPIAIAALVMFTFGLILLISTLNTFFRDCGHLVGVVLQAWYFATPIIYQIDVLPKHMQWWFVFNPAYPIIKLFQEIIAGGRWPDWSTLAMALGVAATSLGVGYGAFKSQENKLVFRL